MTLKAADLFVVCMVVAMFAAITGFVKLQKM